ncbi:MAG: YybS family protein [Treponema sp.]|jgi:hypothetical protein|nr:YybS family protein [Treponema sp.]
MSVTEHPSAVPAGNRRDSGFVPALLCAGLSAVLMRSGFLSFFFLIPLGYCAAAYNARAARTAVLGAIGLHILISLGPGIFFQESLSGLLLVVLYYTVMCGAFFWIMAPPVRGPAVLKVRTAYRLIFGALAGALSFMFVVYIPSNNADFSTFFRSQAETLSSLYIASSGADAVRRSFLESVVTPERILEILTLAALRGGAVASCLFLFFISRQIALSLAWMIRRVRSSEQTGLRGFYVPPFSIWVLSFSLLAILMFKFLRVPVMETIAWNVLIICLMLFLAQGGGVALFMLTRRMIPPLLRLLLHIIVIVLIFSPGINAVVLGGLVLLGIAENWVSFRAPKSDGSSSTPGM